VCVENPEVRDRAVCRKALLQFPGGDDTTGPRSRIGSRPLAFPRAHSERRLASHPGRTTCVWCFQICACLAALRCRSARSGFLQSGIAPTSASRRAGSRMVRLSTRPRPEPAALEARILPPHVVEVAEGLFSCERGYLIKKAAASRSLTFRPGRPWRSRAYPQPVTGLAASVFARAAAAAPTSRRLIRRSSIRDSTLMATAPGQG